MMPSNELKILVIEDDEPKLRSILEFFAEDFPHANVEQAKSLTSAIDALQKNKFDLAIVDMSLPIYDFAVDRAGGGPPQGFGGEDILYFIDAELPDVHSIVLTQYDEFVDANVERTRSLESVDQSLGNYLGSNYLGVIYYSGRHGEWREKLRMMIRKEMQFEN